MTEVIEGPWAIIGAVASVLVLVFYLYVEFMQPFLMRRRLKKPCKAWFIIPSSNIRSIDYAAQDDREHYVEELVLPADSEVEIEVLYKASVSFTATEIYFGCDDQGNYGLDDKPTIVAFCSHFIERGTSIESPETHPETNYADHHKYYHIRKTKYIARHEYFSLGLKIRTRKVGSYRFCLWFIAEERAQPKNKLFIRVVESPSSRMRCVHPEHRWSGCFVQSGATHN